MKQRPLIGVAVIVVRQDGRVLLGKRRQAHGAGTWQFPGGHLEFNEAIAACARREVAEETGICITNLRQGPYTNDIFDSDGKHYVTLFVVADYVSGIAQVKEPDKCESWQWLQWGRFPEPCFLPICNLMRQGFQPQQALHDMAAGKADAKAPQALTPAAVHVAPGPG
jgi:8-oxo-dGTP diphosphatase